MSRRRKRKMGLVKSKSASPMATEDIQIMEDLKYLPDELLLLILSWVPGRSLVRECRLVCRKWRDLIDKPTLWRLKCQRDPLSKAAVEAVQGASQIDWRRISILRPFGRNLIKNPCGKKQFQHWEIENGGDGWKVEGNRDRVEGAEAQTCFVSSYGWCVKSQVVDLLQEGLGEELMDAFQPDICIADWCPTFSGNTAPESAISISGTQGRTPSSGQDIMERESQTQRSKLNSPRSPWVHPRRHINAVWHHCNFHGVVRWSPRSCGFPRS
ncbi:F-box only protein 17-like isoform X2 [Anolis sagrei]|uniref:F-box only protein 17-like isoform X2 n=1 Tax=Anolis sagrei TaxID=38937 RepID=UPI003522B5F4